MDTPSSFPFSMPTDFATKGNQAVGDVMPLFLECLQQTSLGGLQATGLCSHKQSYGVQTPRHPSPPRGLELDSLLICNFLTLIDQSLVMDPKQLIKSVSALCLSQQVPSYNSKRAVETRQNKTTNKKTKQNRKTHCKNRNNPEKPSELK